MESKQGAVLHFNRVQALETWQKITNTKLTQVNGQRKYGGPPEVWAGPTPGAHCEIFINQIPRDAYEDLLIPLFSSVGPLWEFRLMMNFSGENRGFAYAKYGSSEVAAEAVRLLNDHMLQPGCFLKVHHSTEKRHLCVGHLPADTSREVLLQVLRDLAEGVVSVSLTAGPDLVGVTATVAFSSHYAASMAKKILVEAFKKRFALAVSVQWQPAVKHPTRLPSRQPSQLDQVLNSSHPSNMQPKPPSPLCKAVGMKTWFSSSSSQKNLESAGSPVMPQSGFGKLLCDITFSHTGPGGDLYFTYSLCIPGVSMLYKGLVMVSPGQSITTTLEKARQAAVQQLLQRLSGLPTGGLIRDQ